MQFDKFFRALAPKCQNIFFFLQKVFSSKIKFWTKFFCTHKLQLNKVFDAFAPKFHTIFPHSPKRVKKLIIFLRKNSPIKNLHRTHRMQFSKTCRKFSPKVRKDYSQSPEIKKHFKKFVFINDSSKNIPWTLENTFDDPTRLVSPETGTFSSKSENNWKFWRVRGKEKISPKISSERKECSFDHDVKKFFNDFQPFSFKVVGTRKFPRGKW